MLLCIIGSICFFFFFFFFCTDVIVQYMVLRCYRTLLAMMLFCQYNIALILLCIGSRTFSIGTDVIVQLLYLVLRVLELVLAMML